MENSEDPDQLFSEEACELIWIYSAFNRFYIQFHSVFKRVYTCTCILFMCDLRSLGQENFFGQVPDGNLLVPEQVSTFAISTSLQPREPKIIKLIIC